MLGNFVLTACVSHFKLVEIVLPKDASSVCGFGAIFGHSEVSGRKVTPERVRDGVMGNMIMLGACFPCEYDLYERFVSLIGMLIVERSDSWRCGSRGAY